MNRIMLLLATFYFTCLSAFGTTFLETSISDRLHGARGVIKGKYLGSSSKRLPNGEIVTEASFHIIGLSGIRPNEIVNHQNFKVLLPGGSWQGRSYRVQGVPEFKEGELSYLILAEAKFGYMLANLSMSKFVSIKRGGVDYLQSPVFSEKKGVGLISQNEFEELVKSTFGKKITNYDVDKYIDRSTADYQERVERRPSSVSKEQERKGSLNFSMMWLILTLGILGFVSSLVNKGKKDETKTK